MSERKKFDYEIKECIGVLSAEDKTVRKELNLVSWNENKAVYDLRNWKIGEDGSRSPLKGLTFSSAELEILKTLLNGLEILK